MRNVQYIFPDFCSILTPPANLTSESVEQIFTAAINSDSSKAASLVAFQNLLALVYCKSGYPGRAYFQLISFRLFSKRCGRFKAYALFFTAFEKVRLDLRPWRRFRQSIMAGHQRPTEVPWPNMAIAMWPLAMLLLLANAAPASSFDDSLT